MASLLMADIARIDLNSPLVRTNAGRILATGDNLAHRYGVKVKRGSQSVAMAGCGVTGYFIRPGESTVVLVGATEDDMAFVDLSEECYAYDGQFALAIKISMDGATRTVRIVDGIISRTQTDSVVAPGESIPSLDDLFAQIAAVEAATEAAQEATAEAVAATAEIRETAQELSASTAPPIIPTATGDGIVAVSDSANRPLSGLTLYGKTTQDGTPTPEAPVELVCVGEGGTITTAVAGRNLLPNTASTYTTNGITFTSNTDGTITANGTSLDRARFVVGSTDLSAGEYIISTGFVGNAITSGVAFASYTEDGVTKYVDTSGVSEKSFTLTKEATVTYTCDVRTAGITLTNLTYYPMIRHASVTDATYEPYKDGGSVTASTPNGLPGIPVSSGGNYTDESGQQWICDEIDFGRGVYIKRVGTVKLASAYGWSTASNALYRGLHEANPAAAEIAGLGDKYILCNYLVCDTPAQIAANVYGIGYGNGTNVYMHIDGITTSEQCNAWIAERDVQVMYRLASAVETPLPASELAAYHAMTTQYPNTTLLNDAGAGMALSYIADTKNYIDQKIAAIAAAMINA